MTTTQNAKELCLRLEAASEGSRELSCDVDIALGKWTPPSRSERVDGRPDVWRRGSTNHFHPYVEATTSLDAALALAERVLDGDFSYDLFHDFGGFNRAKVMGITEMPISGEAKAVTMPLALCIAILRATQEPDQ